MSEQTQTSLPENVQSLIERLEGEGFAACTKTHAAAERRGVPLNHNGPYEVLAVLTKDSVKVVIERNSAPETPGGEAMTTYAPVARITGPRGTAGARVADPDAVLAVTRDVA